jgi:hypothetical protein
MGGWINNAYDDLDTFLFDNQASVLAGRERELIGVTLSSGQCVFDNLIYRESGSFLEGG